MGRIVVRGLLGLVVVVIVVVGGASVWRAVARAQTARSFAIRTPGAIDEAGFVRIGGADQWVTIRGEDRAKPVLLILHGGPGQPQSFLIAQTRPLEHDFVVVQWDQPGAGKTLARAGGRADPALDMATMVRDGLAVTDYLRGHLRRERIVLLGFSWGSQLGVRMVEARPAAFAAYVGTGQASSTQAQSDPVVYRYLLDQAAAAHDAKTSAALKAAGPPPWSRSAVHQVWRASAPYRPPQLSDGDGLRAALLAPHWGLGDVLTLAKGRAALKDTRLEKQIWSFDPATFGAHVAVPVVVIQGARDLTTPTTLARGWFDRLQAPAKTFVAIPGAGHQAMLTDDTAFDRALVAGLRAVGAEPR